MGLRFVQHMAGIVGWNWDLKKNCLGNGIDGSDQDNSDQSRRIRFPSENEILSHKQTTRFWFTKY